MDNCPRCYVFGLVLIVSIIVWNVVITLTLFTDLIDRNKDYNCNISHIVVKLGEQSDVITSINTTTKQLEYHYINLLLKTEALNTSIANLSHPTMREISASLDSVKKAQANIQKKLKVSSYFNDTEGHLKLREEVNSLVANVKYLNESFAYIESKFEAKNQYTARLQDDIDIWKRTSIESLRNMSQRVGRLEDVVNKTSKATSWKNTKFLAIPVCMATFLFVLN